MASQTVGPMKKVALTLSIVDNQTTAESAGPETRFTFIYGIGTQGMSAFEQTLHGKKVGDKLSIRIESDNLQSYFEHLLCPLAEVVTISPPVTLSIEINAVSAVSDREMIKALAQKSGGCSGDCDCGCGC